MKIIAGGRSSGKTTKLVKISNKEWKYIICSDKSRVDNIVRTAEKLGLDIPFPITVDELPLNGRFIKSVLIDDIEDVLKLIIRKNIDFSTTSCEIIKGDNIMNDCIWAYIYLPPLLPPKPPSTPPFKYYKERRKEKEEKRKNHVSERNVFLFRLRNRGSIQK
jgi:hypothetical protein